MSTKRVAFIGTGGRSVSYAQHFLKQGAIDIVALADPVAQNRGAMRQRAGMTHAPEEFADWREMLRVHGDGLDGMVICSPNHLHAEQAIAALERGLPIALEKPLAANQGDCERIIDAERANNGRTLIGFVLRSTPFYSTIKRLVEGGRIGRIVSVQADELVGWMVTSLMARNAWRRRTETSGGSMLEKCCHDVDILNWMIGSRPLRVNSFGGCLHLNPNSLLPDECPGCPQEKSCNYYQMPVRADHEDAGEQMLHSFVSDTHKCIYNIDKDVLDTQTLAIQYENGALATFLLSFNAAGPRAGRSICLVGTRGMIWGHIDELKVSVYDNHTHETEVFDTAGDGSGHGGGDRAHALNLHRMMCEPDYRPEQNAYAGYLSAMVCFAADHSVREQRQIALRYSIGGQVELQ